MAIRSRQALSQRPDPRFGTTLADLVRCEGGHLA
jgi:hypothetical protein